MKFKWIATATAILMVTSLACAGQNGHGHRRAVGKQSRIYYIGKTSFKLCPNFFDAAGDKCGNRALKRSFKTHLQRDADSDGIPNCRDQDFTRKSAEKDDNVIYDNNQNLNSTQTENC